MKIKHLFRNSMMICLFLILSSQLLIAQWETVTTIESTGFGSNDGWTGSDNGSPFDCSNVSIQKNPAVGDRVWVTHTLDIGYLYRYTFYLKPRLPKVFCEFREGPDDSADGNALPYAYNQQGTANYSYSSGSFDVPDAAAMVCGDTFKFTSGPVTGDGQLHYLKVVITDVQEVAFTKPFRAAHCIIERRIDNSYLYPLAPTGLMIDSIFGQNLVLSWTDNSVNEDGFVVEASLNGGNFIPVDTAVADKITDTLTLTNPGKYELRVYAYNAEGNSAYTNEVTAGIYDAPPAAPSGFTGDIVTSRRVDFEWTDNSDNENGFTLEMNSGDGWTGVDDSPLAPDDTSLTLFTLEPQTDYSFRLFAFNNMGSSDTVTINLQTPDPSGDGIVFPLNAGILNVRDFGAKGDGITDDTKAIQEAMTVGASKFIYFPIGTYLVSDRLEWPGDARTSPLILIGQDKTRTVIKLTGNAPGYQDPSNPRSVIWTQEMGSADNFRNYIRNLTIHTGTGNPGAIGVQFMSNNMGAMKNVDILSGDGSGVTGLDLAYNNLNGPLLISNVKISGFDTGIKCSGAVNSQTLEHIILENQKTCGILNSGQVLSIRDVQSNNTVTALYNESAGGVVTLIGANLNGGQAGNAAIINNGGMFARDVVTDGYSKAIENNAGTQVDAAGPGVTEFVSHPVQTLFPWDKPASLNLQIKDTPDLPWESDLTEWASVTDYGAVADDSNDDTRAIQDAVNSGKSVICFPQGTYNVSGSIELAGNVERIIGFESSIAVGTQAEPVFKLIDSESSPAIVNIEHLSVTPTNTTPAVDNASSGRTLVIRFCKGFGGTHTGTGDVFYEDAGTGVRKPLIFTGGAGQHAWIRQLSNEPRDGMTHLENNGANVWILGHKTEQPGTLIKTSNGGKTEVCGEFVYSVGGDNSTFPMYINDNSSMSATMGGAFFSSNYKTYSVIVEETQSGTVKELPAGWLPPRAGFRMLPLYVGYPDDGTGTVPANPSGLSTQATEQTISLSWKDNSYNEEGFIIEIKSGDGAFEVIDSVRANITSKDVTGLTKGIPYCFRITAYNMLGNSGYSNETCDTIASSDGIDDIRLHDPFTLNRMYPNPFKDRITVEYELDSPANISLRIYDMTGKVIREISNASVTAGQHEMTWDGKTVSGNAARPGIYTIMMTVHRQNGKSGMKILKIVKI